MPSVLYIVMHHADHFEKAITPCLNETKDNDTTASIVGAILGALHGKKAIPALWLDRSRFPGFLTNSRDDAGRVFDLAEAAAEQFS